MVLLPQLNESVIYSFCIVAVIKHKWLASGHTFPERNQWGHINRMAAISRCQQFHRFVKMHLFVMTHLKYQIKHLAFKEVLLESHLVVFWWMEASKFRVFPITFDRLLISLILGVRKKIPINIRKWCLTTVRMLLGEMKDFTFQDFHLSNQLREARYVNIFYSSLIGYAINFS